MAEIVIGIGMSHSPMVVTEGAAWPQFGAADRNSQFLRDRSGRAVAFAELERENGGRYAPQAAVENLELQAATVHTAVARLAAELAAAKADVVVVLGDDQMELHDLDNMPALGVYYGAELVSAIGARFGTYEQDVGSVDFRAGYGQDRHHRWPGHEPFARHLIASLLDQGFDAAAMAGVPDGAEGVGIGHAFGIVAVQLMNGAKLPMVPVYLNTYWPPNQLSPRRCWQLGAALRRAIEAHPEPLRVAVVASGGLSHFVTDEELDEEVRAALRDGDEETLTGLPAERLQGGNSEIRNWVALAAACGELPVAWEVYEPVYRTTAGTGCGLTFMCWRPDGD
jgi:hypothetical protein